ncbi:MAG: SIS domain-containing protein [Candidatus Thermoplasmatota archaeon]|nr:SIS domain-containing protein [Candidatus Thermoplasmatota archaeon]
MAAVLEQVDTENVERAVDLFRDKPRVFVYGTGRSGLVSRAFAIRLVHLGFQTFVIGETITAPVQKDDLVVLVSGSGETIPVAMTADIAQQLGAKIIAVTADRGSHISRAADVLLHLDADNGDGDLAPLGTLFEASAWVVLDGIIAELMERTGEDEDDMRERHATLE